MSIKTRLVISISVLVAIALVVIGGVTVGVTRAQMIARVDQSLAAAPVNHLREGPRQGGLDQNRYTGRTIAILVVDRSGTLVYLEPSGFADNPDPLPALNGRAFPSRGERFFSTGAADGSNRRFRVYVRPLQGNRYVIAATPLDTVNVTTRNLIFVIVVAGASVLTGVVVVTWLTIRRGLQPIDDMIGTAGLIAHGDLSRRIEHEDATTEVGQLGQALNEMLGRIEASFAAREASEQRLRQFVADASHELRTPLTSIRGYAELYRSGAAAEPEGLARVMARIESEGARMGELVEDLLLLARLDQGRPLRADAVDLAALAADAVMDLRAVAPNRPVAFERPHSARILGDAARVRQALDNLLTNARIHTDPGTLVRVTISGSENDISVSVADDGPGIPAGAAERVFDRFYRVDTARARSSGGAGLGLSIVASIVEAHGGQVTLETEPGRGTTVTLTFPRLSETAPRAASESSGVDSSGQGHEGPGTRDDIERPEPDS
ncbi:MAG TPA: HAMP domain-containing sensor histidine kinase [Thermomicrobiales bacterium]|nr:HAMP domain-containing sensor histidine kinase [Thermomicrobiales bacterium]